MSVFSGRTGLTSVKLSKNMTSIPNYTFNGCKSLTDIIIPSNITSIGVGAFDDCDSLVSIIIPESVKSVGLAVFSWCDKLERVTFLNSEAEFDRRPLEHCDNAAIYGYSGSTAQAVAAKYSIPFVSLGEIPAPAKGDVSGDGEIGADDAQMTLKAYVNILAEKDTGLTEAQKKAADVDGNGEITATDAQIILKYYVNMLAGKDVTWEQLIPKKQ